VEEKQECKTDHEEECWEVLDKACTLHPQCETVFEEHCSTIYKTICPEKKEEDDFADFGKKSKKHGVSVCVNTCNGIITGTLFCTGIDWRQFFYIIFTHSGSVVNCGTFFKPSDRRSKMVTRFLYLGLPVHGKKIFKGFKHFH
jgi:hypothetical protein